MPLKDRKIQKITSVAEGDTREKIFGFSIKSEDKMIILRRINQRVTSFRLAFVLQVCPANPYGITYTVYFQYSRY